MCIDGLHGLAIWPRCAWVVGNELVSIGNYGFAVMVGVVGRLAEAALEIKSRS